MLDRRNHIGVVEWFRSALSASVVEAWTERSSMLTSDLNMDTTVSARHLSFCNGRSTKSCLALVTLSVLVLSALLQKYCYQHLKERNSNKVLSRLRAFDIPPANLTLSYAHSQKDAYSPATMHQNPKIPDTTAVILNWSRFDNIILISSLLCGQWLEDTIAQVFIWNNNPNMTLTHAVSIDITGWKAAE